MTVVSRDYVLGHEGHEEGTKHTKPLHFSQWNIPLKTSILYARCGSLCS